jgi:PEGA domain
MWLRTLLCFGVIVVCAGTVRAQGAVEYGTVTSASSSTAASVSRVKPPFPTKILPNAANSNAEPNKGAASGTVTVFNSKVEADVNRAYFLTHAGTKAAVLAVRAVPDRAQVWIDGRFVGSPPLQLKISPEKHQVLVRAANMEDHAEAVDLTTTRTRSIEVSLKPVYKDQIYLSWPKQN